MRARCARNLVASTQRGAYHPKRPGLSAHQTTRRDHSSRRRSRCSFGTYGALACRRPTAWRVEMLGQLQCCDRMLSLAYRRLACQFLSKSSVGSLDVDHGDSPDRIFPDAQVARPRAAIRTSCSTRGSRSPTWFAETDLYLTHDGSRGRSREQAKRRVIAVF